VLGDVVLVLDGVGAHVVGKEVVGAQVAHAVRRLSADVGEEDVASLVAFGILQLVPISNPEHVIMPHVTDIDDARFTVLPSCFERFLLRKLFPTTHSIMIAVITANNGIET